MHLLGWMVALGLLSAAAGMAIKDRKPNEAWGYVAVRSNAYLFWWLYEADHPSKPYTELPLVMWLQGGPGASGTGFGNFEEIGPLDTDLKPRNTTWLQAASLLFVDNPVGTGFSYTKDTGAFAKDVDTVAADMMVFLKEFFESKPDLQKIPFYIFSESYGGKMAAAISLSLYTAVQAGSIRCNFGGTALGDSWISPIDSVLTWGPYLYSISLLDEGGLQEVQQSANEVLDAMKQGQFERATDLWSQTEDVIEENTDGVSFYNILTKDSPMAKNLYQGNQRLMNLYLGKLYQHHVQHMQKTNLGELMNGPIREKLKIIPKSVTWGGQSQQVFATMAGDFMKPVIDTVDELLAANVNVTVYNGQLDLIVDTVGQENWVKKLKWPKLDQFKNQKWTALHVCPESSETAAFYKSYDNFSFYWILKAGHMIPSDQGEMALKMLRIITNQEKI